MSSSARNWRLIIGSSTAWLVSVHVRASCKSYLRRLGNTHVAAQTTSARLKCSKNRYHLFFRAWHNLLLFPCSKCFGNKGHFTTYRSSRIVVHFLLNTDESRNDRMWTRPHHWPRGANVVYFCSRNSSLPETIIFCRAIFSKFGLHDNFGSSGKIDQVL